MAALCMGPRASRRAGSEQNRRRARSGGMDWARRCCAQPKATCKSFHGQMGSPVDRELAGVRRRLPGCDAAAVLGKD